MQFTILSKYKEKVSNFKEELYNSNNIKLVDHITFYFKNFNLFKVANFALYSTVNLFRKIS